MRHFLFCILILLSVHSSAQFTGAVWAGARVSGEAAPPVPYEPETLQYIDTLVANSIDTAAVYAVNWLVWSLKGNNPSYPYNYWDSVVNVFPIHGASDISHAIDLKNVAGDKIEWGGGTPPTHIWQGARGSGAGYGMLPARPDSIWMRTGSYAMLVSSYQVFSLANRNLTFGSYVRYGSVSAPVDVFRARVTSSGGVQDFADQTCSQSVNPMASSPTVNFNMYFETSDSVRACFSTGVYSSYECTYVSSPPPTKMPILAYINSTNSGGSWSYGTYTATGDEIDPITCTGVLVYEGRLDVQKSLWLTDMFKVYNEKILR